MERYNRKGLFYKPSAETVKHLKELQIFFNGKTRIAYPGKLPLVFDLETVCQMVVTHEESHFNQAKEVLEKSESPEEAASDVRQLADNFCYAGVRKKLRLRLTPYYQICLQFHNPPVTSLAEL